MPKKKNKNRPQPAHIVKPAPTLSSAPFIESPVDAAPFSTPTAPKNLPVETQSQRWVKYGLNVVLTAVIVVILAGFLTYIAQKQNWRKDTTAGGVYSLKPQTVGIVNSLDSRMRLQKAQIILDVELPKVIDKLGTLTEAAPPTPPTPATQPASKLIPAAQFLRDRLATNRAVTRESLRDAKADGAKIADQFRRDLEDIAAQAAKTPAPADAKKASEVQDAIRTVQSLAQQLKEFSPKMKIVGLFTKARSEENQKVVEDVEAKPEVRFQQVSDLLSEYAQKSGGRISVDMIDPTNDPERLAQFFRDVQEKYGNDVKQYREVLDDYSNTVKEIDTAVKQQGAAMKSLPKVEAENIADALEVASNTFDSIGAGVKQIEAKVKDELGNRVPNYRGATAAVQIWLADVQRRTSALSKAFVRIAEDPKAPAPMKETLKAIAARFTSISSSAEGLVTRITALPELKQFDELQQNRSNTIAVLGEYDVKSIPFESIYQIDEGVRTEGKVRPRFAGEQQVSAAIVNLTSSVRKKVAFVRSGGPPLTTPIRGTPPFFILGQRLRELDIDVLEKDLSGQWAAQAMQMQMQMRMPMPPEASDEDLRDAAWIIPVLPQDPQQLMMNPTAGLGPKIQAHLAAGGSAMLLLTPQTEKMEFLKEWGIDARTDYVAVHEKIEQQGARSDDPALDWWRQQIVFLVKEYGDHAVTRPLRSLDGFLIAPVPTLAIAPKDKDIQVTSLLPLPNNPSSWGETDIAALREGKNVEFNPKKGDKDDDLPPPLFAGAAAEKSSTGQRLIVLGSIDFATNQWVGYPDDEIRRSTGRLVPRFPANAELFINSTYWLLKMDAMIAISPASMQISRIDPQMSDGRRDLWRILMIAGLPLTILAAGTLVYLKRRD